MITSSTAPASIPARRTASRITMAPRRGAGSGASPPRYFPMGVRTADRMTAVVGSVVLIPAFRSTPDLRPGSVCTGVS